MIHACIRGLGAALCLVAFAAIAQDSGNWDGLVQVKPKRLDAVFLLPGADFRSYNKIMMDPVEVAFEKDWLKDYNRETTMSQRLTQEDIERIVQAAREGFTEIFTEAYQKAGMELVTAPGADVLRLRPGVVDLFVSAPDTMTRRPFAHLLDGGRPRNAVPGSPRLDNRGAARAGAGQARDSQLRAGAGLEPGHQQRGFPHAVQAMGGHQHQGFRGIARAFARSHRPEARPEASGLKRCP